MVKLNEALENMKNSGMLNLSGVGVYGKVGVTEPDTRYNTPKEAPKASEESIDKTIKETEIYRREKVAILQSRVLSTD